MAQPDRRPIEVAVVHTLPGRTRLRVDRQSRAAEMDRLVERLRGHSNVRRVTANPRTGGMLLEHDGTIAKIADDLHEAFRIVLPSPARRPRARDPVSLTPYHALALGCVMLGAYQLRRGRVWGAASENFWNAWNAWRNVKSPALSAVLLGSGLVQLARGNILSSATSLIYYAGTLRSLGAERPRQGRRG